VCETQVANNLSRFEAAARIVEEKDIDNDFPDELVMVISTPSILWYDDFANFIVCGLLPDDLSSHQKRKFFGCE